MRASGAQLTAVRPEIRRSWARSAMCGLDRGSELDLPYAPDIHAEERFLAAASPVIDRVGGFLEGSNAAAFLTDAHGRVLMSKCGDGTLCRRLERTNSVTGFEWSEEHSGTTAISLAIEERMPALVSAQEHYLEVLEHLCCAAVPLVHPINRRLLGVVDVTTELKNGSSMMMPVVLQAAKAIEDRLYEGASDTERVLLAEFMAASRRTNRPVIMLGERVELSTPQAARLLDVADRTVLWQRASDLVEREPRTRGTFTLNDGRQIEASFRRVDVAGRQAGVAIEIDVHQQRSALDPATSPTIAADASGPRPRPAAAERHSGIASVFVGRSSVVQSLREQAEELRGDKIPLLICGESGVGKLTLAKAIAGEGAERVLIDAARTPVDGEDRLLDQIAAVVDSPGKTVIVRRAGSLSQRAMRGIASIAADAETSGSRLIATATIYPGDGDAAVSHDVFGLKIVIPPLRERSEDLLDLIPHLIARRGATAAMAPSAVQALMRCEWSGNAREVDVVIRAILTRKRTTDIILADLPPEYQRGGRRLRRIEHVERAAILQALAEVDGNKTRAADLLEIGRATLYRKIRSYGLDLEATTS